MIVKKSHKKYRQLQKKAQAIIKTNIYLTLATSDKKPWAAPVYYAVNKKYHFFYISQLTSRHTKHILKNKHVAFAIFDSTQTEGTGVGIQVSGQARQLRNSELNQALKWYKTTFVTLKPETFMHPNPYRFFKIVPDHFYISDPDSETDRRIEVKL